MYFTPEYSYSFGWIYRNDICFYTCNVGISAYTLYPNRNYCTVYCVMCISVFKQNYYIARIMLVLP